MILVYFTQGRSYYVPLRPLFCHNLVYVIGSTYSFATDEFLYSTTHSRYKNKSKPWGHSSAHRHSHRPSFSPISLGTATTFINSAHAFWQCSSLKPGTQRF